MQTIAVDIDDVIACHYEQLVAFHNENYGTQLTLDDYKSQRWSEIWGVSKAETNRRAQEFAESGRHGSFQLVDGAVEAIAKLEKRYYLVIVTARRQTNIGHTHDWLNRHFPGVFKDVRFVPIWEKNNRMTKAQICQEIGAGYLVDDDVNHCVLAAESGLRSVLFGNYPWNQADVLPKTVVRCADWSTVAEYFRV